MPIAPVDPADISAVEQGFTIVETLVALFVFAMAGVALITMQSQSVNVLSRVESRAIANLVAENQLIDAMARRATPELGVSSGEITLAGRPWRWQLEVSATYDPTTLRLKSEAFEPQSEDSESSVTAYVVAGGAR